jgi:spermidine synthase
MSDRTAQPIFQGTPQDTSVQRPYVFETLDCKSLCFSVMSTQSSMWLHDPVALVLEYTELMMGFILFDPNPSDITVIGLGGGSISKYCYYNLPKANQTVVEIDPDVIALRQVFHVPADNHRFRVIRGNGAQFVRNRTGSIRLLMADGFVEDEIPEDLCDIKFYRACHDALTWGGHAVFNLHLGRCYAKTLTKILEVFAGNVIAVPEREGSNVIVFARKGQPLTAVDPTTLRRPADFAVNYWNALQSTLTYVHRAANEKKKLSKN